MPTNKKNKQSFASRIEPKLSIPVIILIVIVWTAGMTYAMSFIKTDSTSEADSSEVIEIDESEPEAQPTEEDTTETPIEGAN